MHVFFCKYFIYAFFVFLFAILYVWKLVNNLITVKKKDCKILSHFFPEISRLFNLEYHGQPSFEIAFVMFGLVFMKFRKLNILRRENKKLDLRKIFLRYFHCFSQDIPLNFFLTSSDWNLGKVYSLFPHLDW